MSSAAKHAVHEALLWGAAALCGICPLYYLRRHLSRAGPGRRYREGGCGAAAGPTPRPGFAREVRVKADPRGHFVFERRSTTGR